jgi:hypothetical protein
MYCAYSSSVSLGTFPLLLFVVLLIYKILHVGIL